jgi:hypothetical protein
MDLRSCSRILPLPTDVPLPLPMKDGYCLHGETELKDTFVSLCFPKFNLFFSKKRQAQGIAFGVRDVRRKKELFFFY